MLLSLLDRRVPQLLGVYLAASWGCLEFTSFAVGQFALSPAITSLVFMLLLMLIPIVVILAWRHGAPGPSDWTKVDSAAAGLNLAVAAIILFVSFSDQELGAATTVKLVEDLDGNTVERVVPKAEFRRSVLVYHFDNATGDEDLDWLETAFPIGVMLDMAQDVFITAVPITDPTVTERIREAGFDVGDEIPLSLKREAAERRSLPFFISGSVRSVGGTLEVETALFDTRNARQLATHSYSGEDPLRLADQISVDLRRDLGIPDWQIEESVDLPAAELISSSPDAFRLFVEAQAAFADNDILSSRRKSEEAIALDSTFAMAYMTAGMAALFAGDRTAGGELYSASSRYAYRLPERVRLSQQLVSEWLFNQNPEGAIQAGRYWVELYPADADARRLLATLYAATGDQDETITQSRALLALDSADVNSVRQLASAFRIRQDYDSAIVYYEKLTARKPADLQTRLDIAATRGSLGQFDLARTELEQATVSSPDAPEPINRLARLDMREGLYDDAAARTQRVSELSRTPQERADAAGLEEQLYYDRGQFELLKDAYLRRLAIKAEFEPAVQIVTTIGDSEALRFAHEWGRGDWALRQLDSLRNLAEAPFNLELDGAAVRIHLSRGDVEASRQSLANLQQLAETFATNRPQQAFHRWIEGRIAEIEDGDCSRALASYDQARELSPLSTLYRSSRLRCLISADRWGEAQQEADYLIERTPGYGVWRLNIARYHAARGQNDEAIDHLEAAVDIWSEADADYIPAQEARELLAELRAS